MELLNIVFVKTIGKFPLSSFISCCVDRDFSGIVVQGKPNEAQIQEAWLVLLSQYHESRKDEKTREHIDLLWRMQQLKVRAEVINLLLNTLNLLPVKSLIDKIKELDSEFEQFEFSEESLQDDIQMVKNIEINNSIEYSQLKEQLNAFELLIGIKDKDGKLIEKEEMKEDVFYDYVLSYNEIFKTSHSVDKLSTIEYAKMCYRHDKYIDNINSKNNNG